MFGFEGWGLVLREAGQSGGTDRVRVGRPNARFKRRKPYERRDRPELVYVVWAVGCEVAE